MFHSTNHKIYVPDYEKLVIHQTNYINGLLGLWYANEHSDWQASFGKNVYKFGIKDPKSCDISISLLSMMNRQTSAEEYTKFRLDLLKIGYTHIRVIEGGGKCDMGVVLNFDHIVEWEFIQ